MPFQKGHQGIELGFIDNACLPKHGHARSESVGTFHGSPSLARDDGRSAPGCTSSCRVCFWIISCSDNLCYNVSMRYADWTDADWDRFIKHVRSKAPTPLDDSEIRRIAFSYMQGGGNSHGLIGTHIAMCVDEMQAR